MHRSLRSKLSDVLCHSPVRLASLATLVWLAACGRVPATPLHLRQALPTVALPATPPQALLPLIVAQRTATALHTAPPLASTRTDDLAARPVHTTGTPTPPPATPDLCAAQVRRVGDHLELNGAPFVFVGVNAIALMDEGLPESELPGILDTLQSWGVNMVRIWVKPGWDLNRLERLLDLSTPRGIRYTVTLQDYYHYKDLRWFSTFYLTEDLPHIEQVVTRFRDRPEIAIWEVMNEPWCGASGEVEDPGCYRILQAWGEETTALIKRLDPCRPVSLGTMGARHLPIEHEAYRALSALATVDILSMHRVPGDWYRDPVELEIARELDKPIMLGEVTVLGYSASCEQLGPFVVPDRARLLDTDMHKALELGVDGYLLWEYAPGTVTGPDGQVRHFCSVYGYLSNDPVGAVIRKLEIPRPPIAAQP
jgi:hypothetical protein